MMGYGLYVQHSMGERGRVRRRKAKIAAAAVAAAKEVVSDDLTTTTAKDSSQDKEEEDDGSSSSSTTPILTTKERLEKCNAEWKKHYDIHLNNKRESDVNLATNNKRESDVNLTTVPEIRMGETRPTQHNLADAARSEQVSLPTRNALHQDMVRAVLLGSSPTSVMSILPSMINSTDETLPPEEMAKTSATLPLSASTSVLSAIGTNDSKKLVLSSTSRSNSHQKDKKNAVTFGSVEVREYNVVIGSHPWCNKGLALSLGWHYCEPQLYSIQDHQERIIPEHRRRRVHGHGAMYSKYEKEQEQDQTCQHSPSSSLKRRSSSLSWLDFLSSSLTSLASLDETFDSCDSTEQSSISGSSIPLDTDETCEYDFGIFEDVLDDDDKCKGHGDNMSMDDDVIKQEEWLTKLSNDRRPSCEYRLTYEERLQLLQLLSKHRISEGQLRRIERDQERLCRMDLASSKINTSELIKQDGGVRSVLVHPSRQTCCSSLLQQRRRRKSVGSIGASVTAAGHMLFGGPTTANVVVSGGIRRSRRYRSCGRFTSRM